MKRNLKNIIMISLTVIMIGVLVFSTIYVKKNYATQNSMPMNGENGGMQPPDNNNLNDKKEDDSTNNKEEPPTFDKDNSNTAGANNNNDNNNSQPTGPMGMNKPDMMPNNQSLPTWYYVLIIGDSLVIAILLVYLIMSNFNKKNFKETFVNKDKVIIYILSALILSSVISFADYKLVSNSSSNSDMKPNDNANSSVTYSSKTTITEDKTISSGSYSSSSSDENAILVDGSVSVNIEGVEVSKSGDSDGGDNTSFYGNNSAILAKGGANVVIKDSSINTSAKGANGVFSYGGSATTNNSSSDNTTVTIENSTITTTGDNSGGIMTTGGGKTIANNLTITTAGTSSAAIRTDRGGGTVTVSGGTYKTTGKGSPSIYSTADISVSNATLLATASEGVVIEGKNSVTLDNVTLTDTNNMLNGQSTTYKNIFLYQSMSGDASVGNATFTAKNSKIVTNKGDSFYITNTTATINLENNTIINNDTTGNFLRSQKDSWGNSGENGGVVTLNMKNQKVSGNIVIDSISTLDMNLESSSYYEGIINASNSAKSITLTLDKTSKVKLLGDCYITSLTNEDSENSNIDFNGFKLYVNGKAIN